jgi:hypothetical protein
MMNILDSLTINHWNALTKLRIIVGLIFIFSTTSIIIVFLVSFAITAVLILLSYLLIVILTIKVFRIKKL